MGQKTHPVGFRLQINKKWKSTWFTENSFASELESDVKIRKYLKARLPNAGISKVDSTVASASASKAPSYSTQLNSKFSVKL